LRSSILMGKVFRYILWFVAFFTIGVLLSILSYILKEGIGGISLDFLLGKPGAMGKEGGIFPIIVGTIYVTVVSIAIATPIGIGGAIYFNEYSRDTRFIRVLRFGTETLAGIPSIIFGLFGFTFFVIWLGLGWSIISGGLTLAFMILPTIVRTSEEALKAVPRSYREGSLALGATMWESIVNIVLPAASPGIVTGIILSIGRAIGETAAVLLTAGSSLKIPHSLLDPARTMSIHLYILTTEGLSMENAYRTATVLVFMILIINTTANLLRKKLSSRAYKG
jgi:phosphate transport system permease protein